MKNKLVGALASILASALIAGPVNNPASSAQFESGLFTGAQQDYTVRLGVVSDMVKDRKLEDKTNKSHVDGSEIARDGVVLTLGLLDRFDVFFGAGVAQMNTIQRNAGNDMTMTTAPGSYWTFGARGILWTMDNTTINAFGDYSKMHADVCSVTLGSRDSGFTGARVKGSDWQVGLGMSQTFQVSPDLSIIPGLTVSYCDGTYKTENNQVTVGVPGADAATVTLNELRARGKFGVGLNCGFYASKTFAVNFEGRCGAETACGMSLEIRL